MEPARRAQALLALVFWSAVACIACPRIEPDPHPIAVDQSSVGTDAPCREVCGDGCIETTPGTCARLRKESKCECERFATPPARS